LNKWKLGRKCSKALKIAVGSSFAIYIAQQIGLEYATSAGTITLLTIVTTKWETLRLSMYRILSFFITAILTIIVFHLIDQGWIAYGFFIFLIVIICEILGWNTVISVNAVVGMHFLSEKNFSVDFIANEFYLIMLGITIAIVLNLFHGNTTHKKIIIQKMRFVEVRMQDILTELAAFLLNDHLEKDVWTDICELERQLTSCSALAYEYQDNTFSSHPGYYIDYFDMRMKQLTIFHNLNAEMRKIKKMPQQAMIIAEYIYYLKDYVVEINIPHKQIQRLEKLLDHMRRGELPKNREEFESRAILYHVIMDLEDFLLCKQRFVESLTDEQWRLYWREEK